MNEVTRILSAMEQGDPHADEQLVAAGLRGTAQADNEHPSIARGILIAFFSEQLTFSR
jgi:hypothetical protein